MSISRDAIAAYLHTQFSSLASAIGQSATDASDDGYGPDVDNVLRQFDVAESALSSGTVDEADREKAFALGEYFALRRIWRRLGDRANVSIGGNSFNFADMRKNVKEMMEDADAACEALGVGVASGGFDMVRLNLDYVEPEPTA